MSRADAAAVALRDEMKKNDATDNRTLTLYSIVEQLRTLDEMLDDAQGELTDEAELLLEKLEGSLDAKVDSICKLRASRLRSAEACRAEAERLTKRADSYARGAESLRGYLFGCMRVAGRDKVKTALFTVYVNRGRLSVSFDRDVYDLPARFQRHRDPEVNKEALLAAHEAGEELPEGVSVGRKPYLVVQ